MAAPTVTILAPSRVVEFPPTGPRKVIECTIVCDGTVGASPGDIPASLFGLSYIEWSEPAVKSDNTLIITCCPTYDGTSLLGKAAGSAAPAAIPAGTYSLAVRGY
jgi:hypothetical protein